MIKELLKYLKPKYGKEQDGFHGTPSGITINPYRENEIYISDFGLSRSLTHKTIHFLFSSINKKILELENIENKH